MDHRASHFMGQRFYGRGSDNRVKHRTLVRPLVKPF
jgi:hypothetical protein